MLFRRARFFERISLALLLAAANVGLAAEAAAPDPAKIAEVKAIFKEVPLIDGHNDVPWQYRVRAKNHLGQLDLSKDLTGLKPDMHTDIARLRAGGMGGQFWSVYIPATFTGSEGVRAVIEQIDLVHRMIACYPETFELALTAADIERIHAKGKIASMIGMEGGHSIGNSLGVLRMLYANGARYMTLTHSSNVDWADSCGDKPRLGGLSKFGEEVVREMNRMGMLVDLSHVSAETMNDALDVAVAPVIFSHSSARAVTNIPRNVPDDVLKRLPKNGGVVMANFFPEFVSEAASAHGKQMRDFELTLKTKYPGEPDKIEAELEAWKKEHPAPKATVGQVADHIDQIRKIAGIDHIGVGGDFDGITSTPVGLEDVSAYPNLFAELLRRGYTKEDLKKIAGLNLLRAMKGAEAAAAKLQKERPPSDVLIDELDPPLPEAKAPVSRFPSR